MTWMILLLFLANPGQAGQWEAPGAVSSDHPLASRAGASVLSRGGNAVDAAVATALAAGVVQPSASGLGGGGFALVVDAQGRTEVMDFREVAPAAATRDMFALGDPPPSSRLGGLAVAVPSEGIGLAQLHRSSGRLPWAEVVRPALDLARRGFPVGAHLAQSLIQAEADGPLLVRALFAGLDHLPAAGQSVRRPSLGRALRAYQRLGADLFRDGWVAQDMVHAAAEAGGVIELDDLRDYSVKPRASLHGEYRGWRVSAMPPPSSGGAVLLQVLGVLESWDVSSMERGSAEHWHLLAEAFKHAYADRARHMGDPDRVVVPLQMLLGRPRREAIAAAFDPSQTRPSESYGAAVDPGQDGGTQHISVLDGQGLAVALTTTVNTGFGSRVVAPRSGIVLNNQMDDFVARPGHPNAYGLVGSEANAVAAGARPLSSMSPTVLVHPDGRRIVVGASGGPTIISATVQVILDLVDFGLSPEEAVASPRMHHQWMPDTLFVEPSVPEAVREGLRARGHTLAEARAFSAVQVVVGGVEQSAEGAADPRKGGSSVRTDQL